MRKRKSILHITDDIIAKDYQNGLSFRTIAKKYKISSATAWYVIVKIYGLKTKPRGHICGENNPRRLFSDAVEKDIIWEYVSGKRQKELGKKYKCSVGTIIRILKRQNCPIKGHVGKHNARFNDNMSYDITGHRRLYIPNHPMASKRGLVIEARLIMSEYLGRKLHRYEHVHHINRIPDDNRIENLKVMMPREHALLHNLKE